MTDLISSLAESIVALINSKPQSPTRVEIEDVLRAACTPILRADAIDLAKFKNIGPGTIIPVPYAEPSLELMKRNTQALKGAMNTSIYGGPTKEDRDRWMFKIFNEQPLETAHRTGPTFTCVRYGHRVSKPIDVCGKCSCGAAKP